MPRNYRSLKKGLIRSDMNKYTLYHLNNFKSPRLVDLTFFQQKWAAKALLRGYHGTEVREGTWSRMFSRRLPAVVPMRYQYLAAHDGSELAAGRGSGVMQTDRNGAPVPALGQIGEKTQRTPYMSMLFHPLERRLETAIFRALFASSVRQARQMVLHGAVKVNGQKMKHPSYLLNPGDMFSVDPDIVLYAMGARKHKADDHRSSPEDRRQYRQDKASQDGKTRRQQKAKDEEISEDNEAKSGEESSEAAVPPQRAERRKLMACRDKVKIILQEQKAELSARKLQQMRVILRNIRLAIGRTPKDGDEASAAIVAETTQRYEKAVDEIMGRASEDAAESDPAKSTDHISAHKARVEAEALEQALERARENPIDASKPYSTPWRPRPYMSAFAFIPRYLEVNHNICSAVYLRHPVARPGLSEVPSPFPQELSQLGFNWYLKRQ